MTVGGSGRAGVRERILRFRYTRTMIASLRTFIALVAIGVAFAAGAATFPTVECDDRPSLGAGRSPALLALLDDHYRWMLRDNPVLASTRGESGYDTELRDESPEAYAKRRLEVAARLAAIRGMDRAGWSEADHLDADLLTDDLERFLDNASIFPEQMPIDILSGPHVSLPQIVEFITVRTPRQRAEYAVRLTKVAGVLEQTMVQLRAGLAAGRVPPKVVMAAAVAGCRAQCSEAIVRDASLSPFYRPFRGSDAGSDEARRALETIANEIVPAFARLAALLEKEYIPRCRDTVGISEGIDGQAAYRIALRNHTTTTLTAAEIHAIGLREVARLKSEMMAAIARTDFPRKADLAGDDLWRAFFVFTREDERFYFADPEAMLREYRDICKRIDPELARLFRSLPRNPYGVRPLPAFAASVSPAAYYYPGSLRGGVPGYFMVNTGSVRQRPRFGMLSLTAHEAVPGHHLQGALSDELEDQHPFRAVASYTAFVEGWALYAERLLLTIGDRAGPIDGSDPERLGFYADPYDNFGRLSDEMWRACRLVVDTGIHAMGWSRERALEYLLFHTAGTEIDLTREIDRYIGWPGQACAYKLGQLSMLELRSKAERELGEGFDVRGFHEAVLGAGALPLPVLEKRVQRWIDTERAARSADKP